MSSLNSEQLAALILEYQRSLPDRIAALEQLWERYWLSPADQELLKSIHRSCHGLAGSGGSFGFRQLSDLAREMEQLVEDAIADTRQSPDISAQSVRALMTAIREAATQKPQFYKEFAC